MTLGFFEQYFALLDGPDPLSAVDLVSGELEFAILFSTKSDERSRQFLGGPDELRAFTDAGDMRGWGHHVLASVSSDDIELVLGETRWDDGAHIGTFVSSGRLDEHGLMTHYLTGRSLTLRFEPPSDAE